MKRFTLLLSLAALAVAAHAQTSAKPAAPASTPGKTPTVAKSTASTAAASHLPPGVPPVHGLIRTAFTLKYQDVKIGTGAVAEPNKMYKVFYTGYLGANGRPDDGHKFDSSDDHRRPVLDKDNKPVMDADGKPKLGDPQPLDFPQGFGRLIPGFDQGFDGMRIGGKRRLFIPWQLAYGAHGRPGPDAAHPGIPPKSDLIFDIELVDVSEMPTMQGRPGMSMPPGAHPMPPGVPPHPAAPAPTGSAQPSTPPAPGSAPAAPAPATPPATQTPPTPPDSTQPK